MPVRHLLHITPSFAPGGAQVRTTQIMNHLGRDFRHTVVSLSGEFTASRLLDASLDVRQLECQLSRNPIAMTRRFSKLLREVNADLVLTYNWGAIDATVASRIAGGAPLIHAEDGFGEGEAARQKRRRVLFRQFALRSAYRVVAPSKTLTQIMQRVWKLRDETIQHIPNGVDLSQFTPPTHRPERRDLVIGTVGHLRPEKNQGVLIAACASLASRVPLQLLIAGDGPERERLERKTQSLGLAERVTFFGQSNGTAELYQRMDLFVLSSRTEQMPLAVLEAMACGLPVVSTDVGDVRTMVSEENRPFIAATEREFQAALDSLAASPAVRTKIGSANRARCIASYDMRQMLARYSALYEAALRNSYVSQN